MTEKRAGAQFTYSIKTASGFRSKMEGRLRSPDHHGVVSAACAGQFTDDVNILTVALDLLAVARRLANGERSDDGHTALRDAAVLAVAKAEGRS